jgi:hypothetical protein
MPRNLKGGVKKQTKFNTLSSLQCLVHMLSLPGASVSVLTINSAVGFILMLSVNTTNPSEIAELPFLGLNDDGTMFNVPVKKLVIKLAILDDNGSELDKYGSIEKSTDTLTAFSLEANRQRKIYIDTLAPSGKPICPSIIDFSYFDTNESVEFLKLLRCKVNSGDTKSLQVVEFLINQVQKVSPPDYANKIPVGNPRKLGLLAMELAENYVTLTDLIAIERVPVATKNHFKSLALAQLLILFLKMGLINGDCHGGNVMVNQMKDKTILIDFGRILNVNDGTIPEYVVNAYNFRCRAPYKNYRTDLRNINMSLDFLMPSRAASSHVDLKQRLKDIIHFMAEVDTAYNITEYDWRFYQMRELLAYLFNIPNGDSIAKNADDEQEINWAVQEISDESFQSVMRDFGMLVTRGNLDSTKNRVSTLAVNGMVSRGEIIENINTANLGVYNKSEELVTLLDNGSRPQECTIMGGKKHTRRYKKSSKKIKNKLKKTRRQKK